MPIYLDEDMHGVCEACGSKAKTRCNDCKATFFCSRVCQRALRYEHKKECPVEAAIARCLDPNTKDSYILDTRRRRPTDGATCLICLEGAGDSDETLFHQGCACRGTAGYAHIRCAFEHVLQRDSDHFETCITCKQPFSGEFSMRLSAACWRRFRRIDALNATTTQEQLNWWKDSHSLLCDEMFKCRCCKESLNLRLDILAVAETMFGSDSMNVIAQLPMVAHCLNASGKASEARDLLAPYAMAWRSAKNTIDRNTGLEVCLAFAGSLAELREFARAEVLLKLVIEDIAQHPGDQGTAGIGEISNGLLTDVFHLSGKYEEALNLANDLLEKLTRTYGSEHPAVLRLRGTRDELLTKLQCATQK